MMEKSKRNVGVLECWKNGKMASGLLFLPVLGPFIVPLFQHSNIPVFGYSSFPLFLIIPTFRLCHYSILSADVSGEALAKSEALAKEDIPVFVFCVLTLFQYSNIPLFPSKGFTYGHH